MADEIKPTPQQSQDAVQLDSLTSLQQTTEGDQASGVTVTDVRVDATVAPPQVGPQDGPSYYLPNTDLTNAPPAQSGDVPASESDSDSANTPQVNDGTEADDTGADFLSVTVADSTETQAAPAQSGEGTSAANGMSSSSGSSSGAPGPTNAARIGTAQTQEQVSAEASGTEQQIQPLVPAPETQPVELTTVPQINGAVVSDPIAPVIPVTGTNEAPVATFTSAQSATEDGSTISGQLTATDADLAAGESLTYALVGESIAGLTLGTDGSWSFDPTNAAYQSLAKDATLPITVTYSVSDGQGGSDTESFTITVTGTNEAPVATFTSAQSATEDGSTISGQLTATDADLAAGESLTYALVGESIAGLTLGTDGSWSFDPTNAAYQSLAKDATLPITVTYSVSDGQGGSDTESFTITVTGTNEAPVATFTSAQSATEDGSTISGQLTATDADLAAGESLTYALVGESIAGLTLGTDGSWSFDPTNAAYQSLAKDATLPITVTYSVSDGQGGSDTESFTITVTGTNDGATITGTRIGALTEDAATNTASGTLNVSDVDTGENVFQTVASGALAGTYGAFTFNATTGAWTYTLDNSKPAVQALGAGVTATDTLTVLSKDGTASETITVTITGTADSIILGTTGADTLTGTSGADTIDGLAGGDTMTGGGGADVFVVSSDFVLPASGNNITASGYDIVTDFESGIDSIRMPVNIVIAPDVNAVNGVVSNVRYTGNRIQSHTIVDGKIKFFSNKNGSSEVIMNTASKVATAVDYLRLNNIGQAGSTVSFGMTTETSTGSGLYKNYIYQQSGSGAGGANSTLVEIWVNTPSYQIPVAANNTQIINPIALDLNQDGVTYIDRSEGVTYDFDNDGSAVSTAWVDSSDGLLAVQTEDGKLNIVFSTQEGETDLEGLAKVYDSNQDGVFDANDVHFGKFGVWQDSNSDGIVQAGEFKTLDEAGIVSLSLESSGEQYLTANGDVIVYGQSTFTTKDGVTHLLEDSGFAIITGTQMIGGISTNEPSLIATVSTTQDGQESLLGYSVVANLDMVEGKVGDELSLVINDGAVTITHTLTAEDVANRRYEFRMSDNVIVTDVTNVVGVHLGALGSAISSYANPVSIPYTLLAPAAYVESHDSADGVVDAESGSQTLQFTVMMSEVLVDPSGESKGLETEDFVVSNGTVTSVSMVDNTHYTLEVESDGQAPLNAVSLDIALTHTPVSELQPLENNSGLVQAADAQAQGPGPDPAEFMLLELGGVTYMIDTSESNAADGVATDDYALTSSLSAPLVAGSWTEVVAGTEPAGEPTEPEEPINPLTDTSAPPMINNEVLDDPRLTDNGSWTP